MKFEDGVMKHYKENVPVNYYEIIMKIMVISH